MSIGNDKWLERIASAPNLEERTRRYDEWSATYDADMRDVGYMNSSVAAALVGRYVPTPGARLLDAGVGTGALGEILAAVGYTDLVGIDISDGMLARARERGVYRELYRATLGEPLAVRDGAFTAVTAMGVMAFGGAPPASLDELVRVTQPGGHIVFNVAQPPWEGGGFREKVAALEAAGRWTQVEIAGPYRPMPYSAVRVAFTTRAFVFRVA
jgi:predicted TPR repeat methyltransferase